MQLQCIALRGIIFDYGATIDSNGVHWAEVIRKGYASVRLDLDDLLFRETYVFVERELAKTAHIQPTHTFLDLMNCKIALQLQYLVDKGILPNRDHTLLQQTIAQYCYDYAASCIDRAKPLLTQLAAKYRLVLVSNFYGNIEAVLTDFGLISFFPQIVESAVVGVRKPDPAIFALGVAQMGFAPVEIAVVGDSYTKDILPALAVGCQAIWLKGKGWEENQPEPEAAVTVIADFQELSFLA